MDLFFPFIHKIKKKELEPEPLYVELYPPPPIYKEVDKKEEESKIIIIEL